MYLILIMTAPILGVALVLPSASAAPTSAASDWASSICPTLTLKRTATIPGANTVNVILSGFPTFTPFEATLSLMCSADRSEADHDR